MKGNLSYQTPDVRVLMWAQEDIITSSIVDNDGDYRDWESGGDAW